MKVLLFRNEVRKHHPEFFLMGLYYPVEHMNAYYTLQAMNLSLMSKHNPDDTNASLLKFNWWKDNIHQAIRKPPLDVPLLICLHAICKKYNLNSSHFRQLFKWREMALKWSQPSTIKQLEDYSEATYSNLMYLFLQIIGKRDVNTDHVASHIGKAFGMLQLIRHTYFHAKQRYTFLPADICAKYHLSEEEIYLLEPKQEICDVVWEVANVAKQHYDHAKKLTYPKDAHCVFLFSTSVDIVLRHLLKNKFDVMNERLSLSRLRFRTQLKMTWNNWRKKL